MKKTAMIWAAALAGATAALAADGKFWGKNDNGRMDWSTAFYWTEMTPAGQGGYARFLSYQLDKLNQDVDGLEIEAFENAGRWMTVTNKPITFTSTHAVLTRDNWDYGTHKPGFDVTLKGTGANALHISSNGDFHLLPPAEDFGVVRILGNTVHAWNTSGSCYTTGDFQLCEGVAHVAPQLAAGAAASVSIATGEGTRFLYGPSLGRLRVDKGAGNAVTLTIGNLERAPGGVMVVESASGDLGGTEKVVVQNGAPAMANGICDASFVGRAATAPYPYSFLAYDATDGFRPAAAAPVAFASAGATDVALIDADTTVSGTRHVHALYVNGQPTITFADESVLQVGDGTHPAGIIFNALTDALIQPTLGGAGGTIAFGGAPGCIYYNNPRGNSTLTVNQTISGTAGVTFAGGWNGTAGTTSYELKQPAGWTGPTVVTRARLVLEAPDRLPADGDIYFLGGRDGSRAASLRIYETMAFGANQRFHFSGWGAHSDFCYAVHTGGVNPTFTFNGPVELWGPVGFLQDGAANNIVFAGGVTGGGISYWRTGTYTFTAPLAYTGRLNVQAANARLVFTGEGRPGTGTIEMPVAGTIRLADLSAAFDFQNAVTEGKGTLQVYNSDVRITGRQKWAKIVAGDGARVGLGADVTAADVATEGNGEVYALDGASPEVHVATASTRPLGVLTIGGGATFVKDGTGTVVVARTAQIAGPVTVANGTLRLDSSLRATASWRLDASDESTVTTNANGCATKWVSANCDGATFNSANNTYVPGYTNTVNGLRVMTFQNDGAHYCRFNSTATLRQKTVYVCVAPKWPEGRNTTLSVWGWTGKGSPEYGLRFEPYNGNTWGTLNYATGGMRQNGRAKYSFTPDGTPQIVGEFNDSGSNYDFPVSVGGYESWRVDYNYNGHICEVVAFDRVLTIDEAKELENDLALKWGLTNEVWHADVPAPGQVLAATVDLALQEGAVLDLNGVDQTVASLSGAGVITNSSERPATLTVTGACSFAGRVCGKATLKAASGAALALDVPDGGVEVAGGTATLAPYEPLPRTNGILYWLDAAWNPAATITTNASGLVTAVKSRGGTVQTFTAYNKGPVYVEKALGGALPAFQFTGPRNSSPCLQTDSAVSTKTIVLVGQVVDDTYAENYFWGRLGYDRGFRCSGTYGLDNGYCFQSSGSSFCCWGDAIWTNGVKATIGYQPSFGLTANPYLLVVTRAPFNTHTIFDNVKNGIGSYENRGCNMYISEVLAYDHALTDDEARQVNDYLKAKWFNGGALPSAATAVFGADATLAVTGGASAELAGAETVGTLKSDAAGGTIGGDVAAARFVYDAQGAQSVLPLSVAGTLSLDAAAAATVLGYANLPIAGWPVLQATARADGSEFASSNLAEDPQWRLQRRDAVWKLAWHGNTMITIR